MRKRYDKEFKAKVALEALKGEKTLQELAITYSVHPNMIALWKKQLMEHASMLYQSKEVPKDSDLVMLYTKAGPKDNEESRITGDLSRTSAFQTVQGFQKIPLFTEGNEYLATESGVGI